MSGGPHVTIPNSGGCHKSHPQRRVHVDVVDLFKLACANPPHSRLWTVTGRVRGALEEAGSGLCSAVPVAEKDNDEPVDQTNVGDGCPPVEELFEREHLANLDGCEHGDRVALGVLRQDGVCRHAGEDVDPQGVEQAEERLPPVHNDIVEVRDRELEGDAGGEVREEGQGLGPEGRLTQDVPHGHRASVERETPSEVLFYAVENDTKPVHLVQEKDSDGAEQRVARLQEGDLQPVNVKVPQHELMLEHGAHHAQARHPRHVHITPHDPVVDLCAVPPPVARRRRLSEPAVCQTVNFFDTFPGDFYRLQPNLLKGSLLRVLLVPQERAPEVLDHLGPKGAFAGEQDRYLAPRNPALPRVSLIHVRMLHQRLHRPLEVLDARKDVVYLCRVCRQVLDLNHRHSLCPFEVHQHLPRVRVALPPGEPLPPPPPPPQHDQVRRAHCKLVPRGLSLEYQERTKFPLIPRESALQRCGEEGSQDDARERDHGCDGAREHGGGADVSVPYCK
mmetsp:Transcript_40605/g.98732  ORF Transcript_40605/g.98732 Transcript_40605/m.98732 type:complete len:504 (+) Transcript_40605:1609-3120(+)